MDDGMKAKLLCKEFNGGWESEGLRGCVSPYLRQVCPGC